MIGGIQCGGGAWRGLAAGLGLFLAGCSVADLADRRIDLAFREAGSATAVYDVGEARIVCHRTPARGRPVVLIQGFGPESRLQWWKQVGPLSRRFELVIPDLVHFGGSVSPAREASPEFQARMLGRLLQRLGVGRAAVVGTSYGGVVAAEFARAYPERVERLVLSDAPLAGFSATEADAAARSLGAARIEDVLLPEDGPALRRLLGLVYHDPPWMPAFVAEDMVERYFSAPRAMQLETLAILRAREQSYLQRRWQFSCPTLVVWGEDDRLVPVSAGRALADRLGSAGRLVILPGAGHAPQLETPRVFNRTVLEFLAGW